MNMNGAKRTDHLALFAPLTLVDFCTKFNAALGLPEMQFDYENETEWGLVEFIGIEYNVSRPFEEGILQAWDNSVPKGCNFGITLSIGKNYHLENESDWVEENLLKVIGKKLAITFGASVYHHRTWLGAGRNEIKNTIFKTMK